MMPAPAVPTSTVTFLFTDIEGSTRLWERHPATMPAALAFHDALVRDAIQSHGGVVFKTVGDAFHAAFADPAAALLAALEAQQGLQAHPWPWPEGLRARMALHTGPAERRDDGDYIGPSLHRVHRLLCAGHGGQTLLTEATRQQAEHTLASGARLRDLGAHRLKDLARPERVYALLHPGLPEEFPPLRSLESFAHNLPIQTTSFIGREQAMEEVKLRLAATRLLTLTGAGGCGKTRLALQVAAETLDEFPDGAWLVELAALSDLGLVPAVVAAALGVREETERPLVQTLAECLRPKSLLLLLDNCEHLIAACASLAETLLQGCPGLHLLITSREPLGLNGETVWRVPSLSVPEPAAACRRAAPSEAVRLFADRAVLSQPGFAVTDRDMPWLTQICRRLDGIPLAIELAAARVRVLSPEQIARRLDNRFRLLTGGSRTALPRQQTLRATLDWSYDLLTEPEQILLRRLSVFAGGWTLTAAEAVCAGEQIESGEVLELLSHLVDKSLVSVEEQEVQEGQVRYRLLETLRTYGQDRLCESGETVPLRARHCDLFLQLALEAEAQLRGLEQGLWLDRLEMEHDNFRAALEWSQSAPNCAETNLCLAGALWWFWYVRGYRREGIAHLDLSLSRPEAALPTAGRAKALSGAGCLAWGQGDVVLARALQQESLDIYRALADRAGIALVLKHLGLVARHCADYAAARASFEESLGIFRALGSRREVSHLLCCLAEMAWFQGDKAAARALQEESLQISRHLGCPRDVGYSLTNLGNVAAMEGNLPAARASLEEGLEIFRRLDEKWAIAYGLWSLANLSLGQGDLHTARGHYRHALILVRDLGSRWSIALAIEVIGYLAVCQGQPERAVRLLGAAEALCMRIHFPLPPVLQPAHERNLAQARAGLGDGAFDRLWQEGYDLPMEQAVEYALAGIAEPA